MLDEITIWLNKQHIWLQEAAHQILASKELSETVIYELADIIKNQSTFDKKGELFPAIKTAHDNKVNLLSLGPVVGIDKLNSEKPLDLEKENLSVVYGQNGSGKSSYVRIIKSICGKFHGSNLISDVYSPPPPKQSCSIKYSVNDESPQEIEWIANSESITDLSTTDIFDAENGSIYIEKETEVTYLPPELSFFEELVDVCEKIRIVLNNEEQKLVSALPEIPERLQFTLLAKEYNALKHNISQNEIDKLVLFSESDEKTMASLKNRLSTDDPILAAKKQKEIKGQIENIKTIIQETVNAVNNESISNIRQKLVIQKQKRKNADEGASVLNSVSKLDGIGNETWRVLWEAAREYSSTNAYAGKEFPNIEKDALCPLCHQKLDDDAKIRLQMFESFVKGSLELEAKKAETAFLEIIENLPDCPTEIILASMYQAAGLDDTITQEISNVLSNVRITLENLHKKDIPDVSPVDISCTNQLLEKLSSLSIEAETSAIQFEEDASTFDREKAQNELLELEAKQWISQQKKAVEVEIKRLQEIEKYHVWKKQTETGKITREASELSEKFITTAYVSRFNDELKKLGASKITVELVKTRGEKGRSKHAVRLKNLVAKDIMPKNILSEGEKRIVSLAAFLADVTGHNANTPFVFDDPISSLDQEFEEKTIERLIELSKNRQVIVFTHRLSFLGIIDDKAERTGVTPNIIHISCEPWGTGNPGDVPIYGQKTKEALNKLKIERLPQAKKVFESKGSEAYYPLCKAICSDFRIILERIVENILLSGIVLRHRRDVQTKNKLIKLLVIEKSDCDNIDGLMTKYSFHEHSQPPEAPVFIPEPIELDTDLANLIKWHEEFQRKQKNA